MRVFEARGLAKVYHMGEVDVHALRGVDLDLRESELIVLLGPSGSGKSTFLNILGGLDVPTSGRVVYRGRDLTSANEAALTEYRRHHVGFVFQFYNLIPSLTARENVALPMILRNEPEDRANERATEVLESVGLGGRVNHLPQQLLVGEMKPTRLAISISSCAGRPCRNSKSP